MKVRIGIGLGTTFAAGADGERFWSVVDACESLGWDSIWLSERITGPIPDTLTAMAAVAGRTRRLKFGPAVMVLPGRNPVLLAKALATIDVLSNGRLVCAFGLGADVASEHQVFLVDRKERATRTHESTLLMKRLWTEEEVTHVGRHFRLDAVRLLPKPIQKPHPDVWFGGHSDAAVTRVGRIGDGWLPSFVSAAEYKSKADTIRTVAAQAGREIEEEHYGALIPYVPDPSAAEMMIGAVRARRPDQDPEDVLVVGDDAALRTRLEMFIEAGASKFVVLPVVAPESITDTLARLYEKVAVPLEN